MTEQARSRNRQTLQAVATASLLLTTWLASASPAALGKGLVKSYAIENQAYTLSAQAEELSRQGNYPSALALLKQAASYDPTSYSERIHLDMADCYQKLKNVDQAIVETKAAYSFNPERTNALYALALIYYQAERFDLCITTLNNYIKVADPAGRTQAQELLARVKSYDCAKLGTAKLGTGQVKEAIKYLELASSADPSANSSCVHANLCFAYRQSGQLDKAIAEGKKALQYDAKDSNVTYNLAISYQDQANFVEAISWLRRYLELESDGNRRTQAEQLISELQDDLKKLKSSNNKRPDYLEILKDNDHLWTWSSTKLPLKIYISPAKGVAGYRSAFRTYVIKALDTWCEASSKKIRYIIVKDKSQADIKVRWTADALNSSSEQRVSAGVTNLTQSENEIIEAVVNLRTTDPFATGFVKNGEMASTTMHEIGHALGLDHSNCIYDVMYFRSFPKQTGQPTTRDRATIALLYGNHPGVTFAPNPEANTPDAVVVFSPPPSFAPPLPPKADKLVPPLFIPPPFNAVKEKLTPPLFVPPLPGKDKPKAPGAPIPTFLPPAIVPTTNDSLKEKKTTKKGAATDMPAPFFMPPPAKQ